MNALLETVWSFLKDNVPEKWRGAAAVILVVVGMGAWAFRAWAEPEYETTAAAKASHDALWEAVKGNTPTAVWDEYDRRYGKKKPKKGKGK